MSRQVEEEPNGTVKGTCDHMSRFLLRSPRAPSPMGAVVHPAHAHGHPVAPFHGDSPDWLALPPAHPSCVCHAVLQPATVMFDEHTAVPSSSLASITSNRPPHAQVSKLGGHDRPLCALGYFHIIYLTVS